MCPWAGRGGEARLMAFVAGKVRGSDGADVRGHLDECQRCSDYVAAQMAIWQLLDEWEPEFVDDSFSSDVKKRVAGIEPEIWPLQVAKFVLVRLRRPAFAVTAVTAILAISIYLKHPFPIHSAPAAPAARVISPGEADQMDRAFDDFQLLHLLDVGVESKKTTQRAM